MQYPDKATVIQQLGLEAHVEGGYFKRTFQADHREKVATDSGLRFSLTSIHYLLTDDAPIGHWHLNKSDIIHYWHMGAPVNYYMIDAEGELTTAVLGPDLKAGQQLQLIVLGGVWKASHLAQGEYGLISEAVAPGFDFEDMSLGCEVELLKKFPEYKGIIQRFSSR